MNTKVSPIELDSILLDESPVVRIKTNHDTIDDYTARYRSNQPMPPITVFWKEGARGYYLGDGMHRYYAACQAGHKTIIAEQREGGWEEALAFALSSNSTHGLPRTNADKRLCIFSAIKQWPKHTNVTIATLCDVDDHTVADVRKEMEAGGDVEKSDTRITKEGKVIPATRQPKKVAAVIVDKNGKPIPQGVIAFWNRADEPKLMIDVVTDVMKQIKKAMDEKDAMFLEVNFTGVLADLEKARRSIGTAIPYAVCTQCQGHPDTQRGGCRLCFGRGLISKFRWDVVPEEVRNMRLSNSSEQTVE